jgi:uncharacterized Tic20 family protein
MVQSILMESNSYLNSNLNSSYVPTGNEKTMAVLSHILTIVAPILAPLIIYLIKKDESNYIAYHAKESLNFQITIAIIAIGLALTIVGVIVIWIIPIVAFICVIIASIKAGEGIFYKYPLTLRLIK